MSISRKDFITYAILVPIMHVITGLLDIPEASSAVCLYAGLGQVWYDSSSCLKKATDPGRIGAKNLPFVEAVLWIARTGSPWRDLLPLFGTWNAVYVRFRDWMKADACKKLFDAVSDDPDMEPARVNVTFVKDDRHGQSEKGGLKAMP
jgi:transposase